MASGERVPNLLSRNTALVFAVLMLFAIVILVFAIQNARETRAQSGVVEDLNSLIKNYQVTLNGRRAQDPEILIGALKQVDHAIAHHSSPINPITVEITDTQRTIHLTIARDSQNTDEYWVFQTGTPSSQGSPGTEAGRVVDSRLREYLSRQGLQ